jgi:transcription elongation factor GreA
MTKKTLSQAAYDALGARCVELETRLLPEAQARVAEIQDNTGDNEGLEAVAAIFEAQGLRGELARLQRMMADAVVVDDSAHEVVAVGATVVIDLGDGPEEYHYDSVEVAGRASLGPSSPIGVAIAGRRAGDTVVAHTPGGELSIDVIDVR